MSSLYRSTAVAALAAGSLWAFSQGASAANVSITAEVSTGNAPLEVMTTPASESGDFIQSLTGTANRSDALSPYAFNTGAGSDGTAAATNASYSALGAVGGSPVGSATYNVNSSSFSFLWGSPDAYNQVEFFSGANGTGSSEGIFTGADLACFISGTCKDTGFDLVTFLASGGDIGSVVLTNSTLHAFEFNVDPAATPLPSAIYLFGSVFGAAYWISRRKRSSASSLGAA